MCPILGLGLDADDDRALKFAVKNIT